MRGIDDTGLATVDAVVGPDILRDEMGGGTSTEGLKTGLGSGGGGGGDGERVDCTRAGSISEAGISEMSPALPSINGDSGEGDDDCSNMTLLRRGELWRNARVPRSGDEPKNKTFEGAEDVRGECSGDDGSDGRGIRLNVDVLRPGGGYFCTGLDGLEGELGPGPALEDDPGCVGCSEEFVSWW